MQNAVQTATDAVTLLAGILSCIESRENEGFLKAEAVFVMRDNNHHVSRDIASVFLRVTLAENPAKRNPQ